MLQIEDKRSPAKRYGDSIIDRYSSPGLKKNETTPQEHYDRIVAQVGRDEAKRIVKTVYGVDL